MEKFLGSFFSCILGVSIGLLAGWYFTPATEIEVITVKVFDGVIDLNQEVGHVITILIWFSIGYYFCYDNHRSKINGA